MCDVTSRTGGSRAIMCQATPVGHLLLKCKISKFSDLDGSDYDGDHPTSRRPILRSRKSSIGDDRASSPEFLQSILKRRSSQEDMVSFGF